MLKHRVRALVVAALILLPVRVFAESITFSPTVWNHGIDVTITGTDLIGQYFGLRKLCLAVETDPSNFSCFGHYDDANKRWVPEDPLIKRWESNQIVFTVPSSAPPRGLVVLFRTFDKETCFGTAGCVQSPESQRDDLGNYGARPEIDGIPGLSSNVLKANQEYEIDGNLFGKEKVYLSIAKSKAAASGHLYQVWEKMPTSYITDWNFDTIRIKPTEDVDLTYGIKVNNGAFDSDAYVPSTSDSSSVAATSSSATSVSNVSEAPFVDVSANADYAAAVAWSKSQGIVTGYSDGTFQPDKPVNRAEFLKIVFGLSVGA